VSLRVQRSHERVFVILTACPACGYDFEPEERRHVHLSAHDPEDFGLTPAGETAPDHDAPLFGGEAVGD
jgi:hypothetical protein